MKAKVPCFLDDDYVPPAASAADFNAGAAAERARANSPEEQARISAIADEIGRQIAAGFIQITKD